MPMLSMSAFGGKANIPASTTRQVSLQFSQRGFLPGRSYDSMPSKEVLMAEVSIEWTADNTETKKCGDRPDQQTAGDDQTPNGHRARVRSHGPDRRPHRRDESHVPVEQQRKRHYADRQHHQSKEEPNANSHHDHPPAG